MRRSYEEWAGDKVSKVIPLGRWQTPEDIAALIVFLSSNKARNITGQTSCRWRICYALVTDQNSLTEHSVLQFLSEGSELWPWIYSQNRRSHNFDRAKPLAARVYARGV